MQNIAISVKDAAAASLTDLAMVQSLADFLKCGLTKIYGK
jgi:hypothetical protein